MNFANLISDLSGNWVRFNRMKARNENTNLESGQTFANFLTEIKADIGYRYKASQVAHMPTDIYIEFYNEVEGVIYRNIITFQADNRLEINVSFHSEFGLVEHDLRKNIFQFLNMKCMKNPPAGQKRQDILRDKFHALTKKQKDAS